MPSVLLQVSVRQGCRALSAVMSVLHSRAADVTALTYDTGSVYASLLIHIKAGPVEGEQLVRQIQRRVDVIDVRLYVPAHVAPPSGRAAAQVALSGAS